jgi:hypothetical protein
MDVSFASITRMPSSVNLITANSPNFGRGRWVPPSPLFHKSVKARERDLKLKYKPRARYEKGTERYVD